MIQAKELRIGNRVNMPFLGSLELEVIGLAVKDDFQLYIQSKSFENTFFEKPEKYRPIPLTEEWLIKLGFDFEKTELGVDFYIKQVGIDFLRFSSKGHWSISSGKSTWYMDRNFKSPKHVHTLQNLYFALTSEELTLKN